MTNQGKGPGPGTTAVWAGEEGVSWEGATQVPLVSSVTFGFESLEAWMETGAGRRPGYLYGRSANPTVDVFERKIAALEGAEAVASFSSGMAAIGNTLFALLEPGRRVVSLRETYGGTSRILLEFLPRWGVEVELCDAENAEAVEAAVSRGCDLLHLESPTNPTLKVLPLERLAAAGRAAGATVVVDNTFATPINQRPLALGAHLVVHSATKFLGGHSDAMAGVVCGDAPRIERIFRFREVQGAVLAPQVAHLLIRSLKTLELRVERHNENALGLARWLERHPEVRRVHYPGLESDPGHQVARGQMRGFGGVVSFELRGDFGRMKRFLERLRYVHRAASLGSVGTLIGPPAVTSHLELSAADRSRLGIPETLVRCAVGIENLSDLIEDFSHALD